jgi:hypothetical protein
LLQIAGTIAAIRGLIKTWGAYASSGESLWPDRLRPTVRAIRRRLPERWHEKGAALAGTVKVTSGAYAALTAGLHDINPANVAGSIAELDLRTRNLFDDIARASVASQVAMDRLRSEFGLQLVEAARGSEREIKRLATGGLRIALWGLGAIAIGGVLQWIAGALWPH